MNELVILTDKQATTTSLIVAEYFKKNHQHIMRDIRKLKDDMDVSKFGQMFSKAGYKDNYKRDQEMYNMNRDGFMLLVMGFSGKKALQIKIQFIEAFNKMEQFILNQQNKQWLEARENGKEIRHEFTDILSLFIDYAYSQGSKSANKYYMNYTKLVNKTLELEAKQRDVVNINILSAISLLENTMGNIIINEMENKTHYKDIYKMCRDNCMEFMKGLFINKPRLSKAV